MWEEMDELLSPEELDALEEALDSSEDPLDYIQRFYCDYCGLEFDYPDELADHEEICELNWGDM